MEIDFLCFSNFDQSCEGLANNPRWNKVKEWWWAISLAIVEQGIVSTNERVEFNFDLTY
jgi:hypothetical protein